MNKDLKFLTHILESAQFIMEWTERISFEKFLQDEVLQNAVMRKFEIIGEASTRISNVFKEHHPDFPWREMKATRNKLIHEYEGVNLRTVWLSIKNDLPQLHANIRRFLDSN